MLLVSEDGTSVTRERLEAIVSATDGHPPLTDLCDLFPETDNPACTADEFECWILKHADLASFSEWLLGESEENGFELEAEPDPPTFYQKLAKMYHCEL